MLYPVSDYPRYCPLCCMIPLTGGRASLVDPETWVTIPRSGWRAKKSKGGWYAMRTYYANGRKKYVYLHRLIMEAPEGLVVHHRNGNTLDNRKANLELMTHSAHQQLNRSRKLQRRLVERGYHKKTA